ncbi:MAG: redox-sensing transcriptional repressor Rex, partial [bacterium]|nr:redox-sensing transcriptional repressor Rex [bacterium]
MSAIGRLGRYIEVIDKLPGGQATVSSQELARLIGATPSTVRQDFHNYLSEKGKSRVGYGVKTLRKTLVQIMGLDRENRIILIGCGKLAQALVGYKEFSNIHIGFPAFFDNDESLVDEVISGIPVYHVAQLKTFLVKNQDIKMAVLTVPANEAQKVAEYA